MENWSIKLSKNGLAKPELIRLHADRIPGTLSKEFYARETLLVAPELLGKILITRSKAGMTAGRIVEVEAYHGTDPASHSSRGPTPRSEIMFGDPGVAYVYYIYGMYEMLNFVTETDGYPGAVLIRAIEPVFGQEIMERRRPHAHDVQLTNGPGKLCRAMGIKLAHNGQSLQGPQIIVVDDGYSAGPKNIRTSPRVGISKAVDNHWRYFLADQRCVSRVPQNSQARIYRP